MDGLAKHFIVDEELDELTRARREIVQGRERHEAEVEADLKRMKVQTRIGRGGLALWAVAVVMAVIAFL